MIGIIVISVEISIIIKSKKKRKQQIYYRLFLPRFKIYLNAASIWFILVDIKSFSRCQRPNLRIITLHVNIMLCVVQPVANKTASSTASNVINNCATFVEMSISRIQAPRTMKLFHTDCVNVNIPWRSASFIHYKI